MNDDQNLNRNQEDRRTHSIQMIVIEMVGCQKSRIFYDNGLLVICDLSNLLLYFFAPLFFHFLYKMNSIAFQI
jgi:hypothetical protein